MDTSEEPLRALDLDPGRVLRADRPHYAIIDIGSNSVRLMVYDQLGRAPMPRFNEKSLCRLAEGLPQTGAIAPDGFRRTVEAMRRFRAIADAMGVSRLDITDAPELEARASRRPPLPRPRGDDRGTDGGDGMAAAYDARGVDKDGQAASRSSGSRARGAAGLAEDRRRAQGAAR